MAVFIGTFENKVDRKGRISVPAAFRQPLVGASFEGIIAFPSRRAPCLEACGQDFFESTVADNMRINLIDDEDNDPAAQIFYDLEKLPFDGDGRITVPASFKDIAGIEDRATFVGIGKVFQIWEPERLAEHKARNRTKNREAANQNGPNSGPNNGGAGS
ncbi:MAG: division/cell wall cluster transcriptional repressor MraZ [Pseudomonadota bacterium]